MLSLVFFQRGRSNQELAQETTLLASDEKACQLELSSLLLKALYWRVDQLWSSPSKATDFYWP